MARCQGLTAKGTQCKNQGKPQFCHAHQQCKKTYVTTTSGQTKPMAVPSTTSSTSKVKTTSTGAHDASALEKRYKSKLISLTQALNDLELVNYWVDLLPSKYRLKMKDVKAALEGERLYVSRPQEYDDWEVLKFGKDLAPSYFTEFQGDAVTGGGDTWAVSKPGLLKAMHDIYMSMTGKPFTMGNQTYLVI